MRQEVLSPASHCVCVSMLVCRKRGTSRPFSSRGLTLLWLLCFVLEFFCMFSVHFLYSFACFCDSSVLRLYQLRETFVINSKTMHTTLMQVDYACAAPCLCASSRLVIRLLVHVCVRPTSILRSALVLIDQTSAFATPNSPTPPLPC